MGTLICSTCGAKAEGETFEIADEKIDHAIGTSKGRPCGGDPIRMTWTGVIRTSSTKPESSPNKPKTKRSTK